MILDTTSKVLEIILGGAATTNNCEFTADYVDTTNGTTFAPGGAIGVSNGATLVVAVPAPAALTQRSVRAFTFFNADTVNTTVTVRIFDGTNRRRIVTITLTPGQSLVFTPEAGWAVLPSTNGQIPGTTTNDSAAPGCVGELITSGLVSGVAMVSTVQKNIAQLTLTPGDWNVFGNGYMASTATVTAAEIALSSTSATVPALGNLGIARLDAAYNVNGDFGFPTGMRPFSVAAGATLPVYLVGFVVYPAGSVAAAGTISARRAR